MKSDIRKARNLGFGVVAPNPRIWAQVIIADLIVIDKKEQKGIIIDIAVRTDVRVEKKEKKSGKVPGFEKRDQKIVEIEKCRNCPCSGRGP